MNHNVNCYENVTVIEIYVDYIFVHSESLILSLVPFHILQFFSAFPLSFISPSVSVIDSPQLVQGTVTASMHAFALYFSVLHRTIFLSSVVSHPSTIQQPAAFTTLVGVIYETHKQL